MGRSRATAVRRTGVVAAVFLLCSSNGSGRTAPPDTLPPRLADFVNRQAKLSAEQHAQLLDGKPVTRLLDVDPSREVSVFGAVWIGAPVQRYVAALKDIEQFENGGNFLVTRRVSSPPRIEDFDQLTLPDEDFTDLRTCKVGSCEVKVSEAALARIQNSTDWSSATARRDVERAVRELALQYVNGYLEGGNARLAVYRDAERPTFVATEIASMIDRMPALTEYLPALKRYLIEFPASTLPNADSFLYWQNVKFGLKPTIRVNHLTIADQKTHVAIVSKMIYASHYFWTALEMRVLVPDTARGQGFWFVNVNRSRSDGLSGFGGKLIRAKVRSETEKGMQSALQSLKAKLERQ